MLLQLKYWQEQGLPQVSIKMNSTSPHAILEFWFSARCRPLWFNSTPEFDGEIAQRFEGVFYEALNDGLSGWQQSPEGCVALVIVLDQFPLNMFRSQPQSFSGEQKAREVARHAIANHFDAPLPDEQKAFLFMPFMHSENLDDQDQGVELFEKAGLKENLRFAKHHRGIIRRFGRFPHRNKILGRQSSQEELDYLSSDAAFLG